MKDIKTVLIIVIICLSILYLFTNVTYTSFQSEVGADTNAQIASWKINLNNQDIAALSQNLTLENISWNSTHTVNTKVAPGSSGITQIVIDPTTTNVAIRYDFTYEDKTNNVENVLTVTNVTINDNSLIKTGINKYTGIITLEEIQANTIKTITISLGWINDEGNNILDSQIGMGSKTTNYVKFNFVASQYNGEEIIPYVE